MARGSAQFARAWIAVRNQIQVVGQRILDFLTLPAEVSPHEGAYLASAQRVVLGFLAIHAAVVPLLALLNRGGFIVALLATAGTLGLGVAATRVLTHPRHASWVLGTAAMVDVVLVMHFARGPWTAETLSYPFVAIAGLALLGDPVVVVIAAAVTTFHHALAAVWIPTSVLPPGAPTEFVLLRVTLLVGEAALAAAVCRRLFDAARGLEARFDAEAAAREEADGELRVSLETVRQGVFTVDARGAMTERYSRAAAEWLGAPQVGAPVWDHFAPHDEDFAHWIALGWQSLDEDILPSELALEQMPKRLAANGRHFDVAVRPAGDRYLVLLDDTSERAARELSQAIQGETASAFAQILRDRNGFMDFCAEMDARTDELCADPPVLRPVDIERTLHLVRGNAEMYGFTSVATVCARVEADYRDTGDPPSPDDLALVARTWRHVHERLAPMIELGPTLDVVQADYERLIDAVRARRPYGELEDAVNALRLEPVRRRFERLEAHARSLAERLGMFDLYVVTDDGGVRVDRDATAPFWSALVHVVRNAVDHGLRGAKLRQLTMTARYAEGGAVEVTVADSGAGIRWDRVASAAAMRGLPLSTRRALTDALFADRLSTKDEASDISGHGHGLAAIRVVCEQSGIERRVVSETGLGTTFTFVLPAEFAGAIAIDEPELRARAG